MLRAPSRNCCILRRQLNTTSRLRPGVIARAAATGGPLTTRPLLLHVGETTLSVPFTAEQARDLRASFQQLFATFTEKQKATRPKRWDMMEWRTVVDERVGVEVFCNPNAHTTAFDAKLLITLWSEQEADGLRVTTEARLSGVTSDLDNYLQA